MPAPREIEIKFVIADMQLLEQQLGKLGFHCGTPPTHEVNTLYDLPEQKLRRKEELLRLRKYGEVWRLTHKARSVAGRHKSRTELETGVANGEQMDRILRTLGYRPVFVYEKYRSEWTDGMGHVVLDRTPIGDVGEVEGRPRWIDRTARALGVALSHYITKSYAELFFDWKRRYKRKALNMTFRECGGRAKTAGKHSSLARVPRKPKPAPEFRPRRALNRSRWLEWTTGNWQLPTSDQIIDRTERIRVSSIQFHYAKRPKTGADGKVIPSREKARAQTPDGKFFVRVGGTGWNLTLGKGRCFPDWETVIEVSLGSAKAELAAKAKGPRRNKLYNLSALRKERVVPVGMEGSWLEVEFRQF